MDIKVVIEKEQLEGADAKKFIAAVETLKRSKSLGHAASIGGFFKAESAVNRPYADDSFKEADAIHDLKLTLLATRDLMDALKLHT